LILPKKARSNLGADAIFLKIVEKWEELKE